MKIRSVEHATLHFKLGEFADTDLVIAAGTQRVALQRHTPETLASHAQRNRGLAALQPQHRALYTHFVEGLRLPSDVSLLLRVTHSAPLAPGRLPELVLLHVHVPVAARERYYRRKLAEGMPRSRRFLQRMPKTPDKIDAAVALQLDLANLVSQQSTATAVIFHHPQLLTSNPDTTQTIVAGHINATANATHMAVFAAQIKRQGQSWQTQQASTSYTGEQLTWGPAFTNQGPVMAYQLSATTVSAAGSPLALPLATTQNDPSLQRSVWNASAGTPSTPAVASTLRGARRRRLASERSATDAATDGYDFALQNRSPGYGLSIDESSMQFTPGTDPGTGTMSINVLNTFLRTLFPFVGFMDEGGKMLGTPEMLDIVTPVNVVLGVPMPTDPTTLTFDWPASASKALLWHGGLGTSNWNNDFVWPGIVMTGVFNYGIPILFLVAGALLDGDGALNEVEKDKKVQKMIQDLGMGILGSTETNSIGFDSLKTILSAFADAIAGFLVHTGLEKLQAWIAEQLGESAFEDAIPFVDIAFQVANRAVDLVEIGETTVEVLLSPAVYEASISRSMPIALTVTPDPTHGTAENAAIWPEDASSYQAFLQYQGGTFFTETGAMESAANSQPIQVSFPSVPAGGNVQGKFAVYAADGTLLGQWTGSWVAAVPPADGSTLTLSGAIQEALVPLTAGTTYQYKQKLVYNETAAAHQWQTTQFSLPASEGAVLNTGVLDATTRAAFGSNGVTLSAGATVTVTTPSSVWNISDGALTYNLVAADPGGVAAILVNNYNAPTAVLPLNGGDSGNNLGALVDITINDRAYMLGYCWEASGQNVSICPSPTPISSQVYTFQNINVLSQPEDSLKFSGCGFGNQPFLVYDQFGPEPLFSAPSTYGADLNAGTVDAGLGALFSQFGYPLPATVTVATITSGAAWTIAPGSPSSGAAPLYQVDRLTDQLNVYPYPTAAVSQRNFYLDPMPISGSGGASYRYQVRQVTLDNTTPFPMNGSLSFGQFLLPALTDVVVHPQGYLVGAHYTSNVLEMLPLPASAASDGSAPAAVIVGGTGTRAGLFNGPVSLTVTADGRVLVLEQGNQRIQAVEVSGNPVFCFTGKAVGSVAASAVSSLDDGVVSATLRTAFSNAGNALPGVWYVQNGTTLFQLAASPSATSCVVTSAGSQLSSVWTITDSSTPAAQVFTCTLNGSQADGTIEVASSSGSSLGSVAATEATRLNSGAMSPAVTTLLSGAGITLVNPLAVTGAGLSLPGSDLATLAAGEIPQDLGSALTGRGFSLVSSATVASLVTVQVQTEGSQWKLTDPTGPYTYLVTAASGTAEIIELVAFTPLQPPSGGGTLQYTSIATELKGYIYTLGYTGNGTSVTDFLLDIYQPDGTFLSRTAGVNAGQIAVDLWRNLYTLNFEALLGPGGRTEPSISTWTPSV